MTAPARPLDRPIVFATDANFPAGADPWSGQPNKIRPTDGILARGFLPSRRLPAAWVNSILADTTARVARLHLAEVLNFSARAAAPEVPSSSRSEVACADAEHGVVWLVGNTGGAGGAYYSADGAIWTEDTGPSAPGVFAGVAHYDLTLCIAEQTTGALHFRVGGVWSKQTIGALSGVTVQGIVANHPDRIAAGGDIFFVYGTASGPTPKIVSVAGVSGTNRPLGGTVPSEPLVALVPTADFVIAFAREGATWRHATGSGTWARGTSEPTLSDDVATAFYDDARGVVVLVTKDGQTWSTEDGISWTQRADLGAAVDLSLNWSTGIAMDGVWIVPGRDTDALGCDRLFVSEDGGASWTRYPAPPTGASVSCWVRWPEADGLLAIGAGGWICRGMRLP